MSTCTRPPFLCSSPIACRLITWCGVTSTTLDWSVAAARAVNGGAMVGNATLRLFSRSCRFLHPCQRI